MPLEGDFPSVITGGQGRGPLLHTLVAMDQRSHAVSVHEEDSSGLPSELVGIDMFPIQTYIKPWQLLHLNLAIESWLTLETKGQGLASRTHLVGTALRGLSTSQLGASRPNPASSNILASSSLSSRVRASRKQN